MRTALLLVILCALPVSGGAQPPAQTSSPGSGAASAPAPATAAKTRLLVLTDIGNEPDDSQSMVRLLVYANEFDIEGLVATTSIHQKEHARPELLTERIGAYEQALPNLRAHANGYPSADALRARVKAGRSEYGAIANVGEGHDSEGSDWIIAVADRPDPRPLWITVWGGARELAQALWKVRKTRTPAQLEQLVAKLRVYTISDQDETGAWLRVEFPRLFSITSVHAFIQYGSSTWSGISGEAWYHFAIPPQLSTIVSNAWLDEHVRNRGRLGKFYPQTVFAMEGDTPSFLYLIPNGLGDPEHPDWGSWGGRYEKVSPLYGLYGNVTDTVTGPDGLSYTSNQATVWRWRTAYQYDFANRMQWAASADVKAANHAPAVVLNGQAGQAPVRLTVAAGTRVTLSAKGTTDPDGALDANGDTASLTYRWLQYPLPRSPILDLPAASVDEVSFVAAEQRWRNPGAPQELHVLLEVTDAGHAGQLPLTRYRRAIVTVTPPAPAPAPARPAGPPSPPAP
jgi:hypothetical protein